jgi:hypothetical protein
MGSAGAGIVVGDKQSLKGLLREYKLSCGLDEFWLSLVKAMELI